MGLVHEVNTRPLVCWVSSAREGRFLVEFHLFLGGAVTGLFTKLIGDWQELDTATHEGMQKNGKYNAIFIHREVASNQILVGPGKKSLICLEDKSMTLREILLSIVPPSNSLVSASDL